MKTEAFSWNVTKVFWSQVGIRELSFSFSRYPTEGLVMQPKNLVYLLWKLCSHLCPVAMVSYLVELDVNDLKLVLPQFNCWLNLGSGHGRQRLVPPSLCLWGERCGGGEGVVRGEGCGQGRGCVVTDGGFDTQRHKPTFTPGDCPKPSEVKPCDSWM